MNWTGAYDSCFLAGDWTGAAHSPSRGRGSISRQRCDSHSSTTLRVGLPRSCITHPDRTGAMRPCPGPVPEGDHKMLGVRISMRDLATHLIWF
jgi:hypothetical protein